MLDVHRPRVEPRVDVIPAYAYTLGPEVRELSERCGQPLDDWQGDALDGMCAVAITPEGHRWACFEYVEIVSRQNGKGAILEARAIAGLLLLGEQLILWSAHEYKTALEGFRRVRALLRTYGRPISPHRIDMGGYQIKISSTNGEEAFERTDTGARLKFVARSKGSGRGFSGDCVIIDEAFAFTNEQQEALMPTMSARPDPQIIYTSSPPLNSASGFPLFALRRRAEEIETLRAANKPVADTLGFRDWGMAGDLDHLDMLDLDKRETWRRTNPAMGIRITEQFVEHERRSMTEKGFARERLGVWPPRPIEGGGVIDPAKWAALIDPESKRVGDVALGVDISLDRSYVAIGIYGLRGDELGHVQLIDHRPGTDWLLDRFLLLRDALDPVAIGMGRGTYESLKLELTRRNVVRSKDPARPERGDLAVTMAADMAAATGQFYDAIRDATLRVAPASRLDEAVSAARVRQVGDALAWARTSTDGADITPLTAVTVARWAYATRAHLVLESEYDISSSLG